MPSGNTSRAVIGGWVLLVITTHQLAAQSPPQQYPAAVPGSGYAVPFEAEMAPSGMDQIRQYPHPGPEWAATHGYPNYDYPDRFFGVWFRSQAWGLTKRERCAIPDPFRPRGFGNLFARPSTSHRMDYNRPYIIDPTSRYGPSYYARQPDPRCCCRNCEGKRVYAESRAAERALSQDCDH